MFWLQLLTWCFVQWHLPGGAGYRTVSPQEIKTAAVIGAGTMGTGIAMAILNAGIPVTLVEQKQKVICSNRAMLFKLDTALYNNIINNTMIETGSFSKKTKTKHCDDM